VRSLQAAYDEGEISNRSFMRNQRGLIRRKMARRVLSARKEGGEATYL
jgi:hypothetical protein